MSAAASMTRKEAAELAATAKGFCKERLVWRLRQPANDSLAEFLALVSIKKTRKEIAPWTPLQCAMAEEYAAQVHLAASDNAFIRIPPRPDFL